MKQSSLGDGKARSGSAAVPVYDEVPDSVSGPVRSSGSESDDSAPPLTSTAAAVSITMDADNRTTAAARACNRVDDVLIMKASRMV